MFGGENTFQSTRPVRGATGRQARPYCDWNISIHAPRAGRDLVYLIVWQLRLYISIHAPRAGRDRHIWNACYGRDQFQSTRPVRGATMGRGWMARQRPDFNPRAPCGARPGVSLDREEYWTFQSTRPVRGATRGRLRNRGRLRFQSTRPVRGATRFTWPAGYDASISIHAPRAGRD